VRVAADVARANPHWRYEVARGIGHVPQLEAPERFVTTTFAWLDAQAPTAVRRELS